MAFLWLIPPVLTVLIWVSPFPGRYPAPPNSTPGPPAAGPQTPEKPSQTSAIALTGEAANEQLRKSGQFESLGAALHAARYVVEKIDPAGPHSRGAEFFAANPKQQLRAWFSKDGIELASGLATPKGVEPWSIKMRFTGLARSGEATTGADDRLMRSDGGRIEINGGKSGVTEWYENRDQGIEHGFTVSRPPAGSGELEVALAVEGNLRLERFSQETSASPSAKRADDDSHTLDRGVRLVDIMGESILHYTGLNAWDANGRSLTAHMELRGTGLALVVADGGAQYPVTIDPLFANVEARLVEDLIEGGELGKSVALSGNTAILGAPNQDTAISSNDGGAYVFVNSGGFWRLEIQLHPANGSMNDHFGESVAISGDSALVGTKRAGNLAGSSQGSVYVFVRTGSTWSQQAELVPIDGEANDSFGEAVALWNDTALVGAPFKRTAAGALAGSAYIYERSGTTWSQQAKLERIAPISGDQFGISVALTGDSALVGASGVDSLTRINAGSAHLYVRNGGTWSQQTEFIAADGVANDLFGQAVALSADTMLVGAPGGMGAGSVYIYVREGAGWSQQAKLSSTNAGFGRTVAVAGDFALLGAGDGPLTGAGSAHVFVRNATTWSFQAKLTASDAAAFDGFGNAVALSVDTAIIGAWRSDTLAGVDSGSGYVFFRNGTAWSQAAKLSTGVDSPVGDNLGISVALDGGTAFVGAPRDDTLFSNDSGSAYLFARSGTTWAQTAKLTAVDGAANDEFGRSVAVSGDTALVGARGDDTPARNNAGSAYVYLRDGPLWSQQAKLTSPDNGTAQFGESVSLEGDTALVGTPLDGDPDGELFAAGCAYIFLRGGSTWIQQAKLTALDRLDFALFGNSVSLNGDKAIIGTPGGGTFDRRSGCAYVFLRTGTIWTQQAKLTPADAGPGDEIGSSVALSGDTVLVGAPNMECTYVFVYDGMNWNQQAKLTPPDGDFEDRFGSAVAIGENTVLIGAPFDDTSAGINAGSAHLFVRVGLTWNPQLQISAGVDASPFDDFGSSVALSGDTALVGGAKDDTSGTDAGSAYVFQTGELPVIILQPIARTVLLGAPVTFILAANGSGPLRYQWRKNGTLIANANTASFTIAAAQVPDAGSYDCIVSNVGGVVTSAAALLTVNALSQFTRVFPATPPPAEGFVIVNLTPPGIGGGWRFVGEQQWRASGVPAGGLATGDRVIEFRPVPGYLQSPPETVSVVSGEAATIVEGDYYETPTPGSGGLSVTLKPDGLAAGTVPVATRAQWRLLGQGDPADPNDLTSSPTWKDSGAVVTGLVPGNYLVECKPLAGRTTPPPATVLVQDGQTSAPTRTYFLADAETGTAPALLPFETVSTAQDLPYAFVGQIRSDAGSSSGFVVKQRVVATAGHVVWDDGTLSAVTGLQWLFQRDRGTYEPKPQIPRGFYIFDGYAAQRTAENTPGTSSPQSQNLDVAAMYFLEDAGRGGYGGFLASDAVSNEFLLSSAQKMLVGYPVDGISTGSQGRMHATPAANIPFAQAFGRTYATSAIHSSGGNSGGPLCVQFEGANYYPAAIYLGGTAQTVVRAIDSPVIDLFNRAEVSGNGGQNNTGGGITHTSVSTVGPSAQPGALTVNIEPVAARNAGAGWRLGSTGYLLSGKRKDALTAGTYILQFTTVPGFQIPTQQSVQVNGGQLKTVTFTYALNQTPLEMWRQANFGSASNTGSGADIADPDKDGRTNIDEYTAGTNPNNAASAFIATSTSDAAGLHIRFTARANRRYRLEASSTLTGAWQTLNSRNPAASDSEVDWLIAPAAARGFYRVMAELE